MSRQKASIIIVTYNGVEWIRKCLDSCNNYSVIIVDNHSTDETVSIIKNEYPQVSLIEEKKNHGFGGANNIGISHALNQGAEYVFLLNQDAYLIGGVIEKLIATHKNNKSLGVLSPIHLNATQKKLDNNFRTYASKSPDFFDSYVLQKTHQDFYEVPFVNAAAWLIPRDILLKIGGFDPVFYHYGEDDNYCNRLIYHNFKIGIVPGTFIIHDREFRETKSSYNASELLIFKERNFKIKYTDINLNINFDSKIKSLKRKMIKKYLKFRFKSAQKDLIEYRLIKKINPSVEKSRKINITRGAHYLEI